MKILLLALLALVFSVVLCPAQNMALRYGVWGAVNFNMHSASFAALPGVDNCCTAFKQGSGIAGSGGVLVDVPLSARTLVGLRAGLSMYNAVVTATENKLVPNRTGTGLTGGVIEHSIDAALPALGAEMLFGYRLANRLTAYVGVRGDVLLGASFVQKETLLEPSYGTFENDSRVRNERSGDIPGASSVLAFALVGMGYETPLNASRTLVAAPELMVMLGLNSLADDISWKAHSIRVGLAIAYTPPIVQPPVLIIPDVEEPLPVAAPASTVEAVPQPALTMEIAGVQADGSEHPVPALRIEEVVVTDMTPLLGYVFFDEGSAVLPERYNHLRSSEVSAFSEESIDADNALDVYHHVLNIVGRRMLDLPEATITLTGCTSEFGADRNSTLARRRAEIVRDYLVSVWGIESGRIRLASRGLPAQPSNSAHADGREENRRVEIASDRRELLRPVMMRDTARVPYPAVLKVLPSAREQQISTWTVSMAQGGTIVDEISGSGAWPAAVEVPVERAIYKLSMQSGKLTLTAKARYEGRLTMAAAEEVPMEWVTLETKAMQRLADRTIDRYSLLLFNFDDAALGEASRPIVDLIRQRITPASTLVITGYTDRTGEADYNRRLSAQRAAHTAEALGISGAQPEGRGNDILLFTNDIPEGRFYCRTVTITVETPVKR